MTTITPYTKYISPAITALLSAILSGCGTLPMAQPEGVNLTRASFGPLNPQHLPAGLSLCNANIGGGIDSAVTSALGSLINPLRNPSGQPDANLSAEALTPYFSFLTTSAGPVIRVLQYNEGSIDFWFQGDAAREASKSESAAADYCHRRKQPKIARYVGFSYQCGKTSTLPVQVGSSRVQVVDEQIIVAYDCVSP